jgi:hypothetical protein
MGNSTSNLLKSEHNKTPAVLSRGPKLGHQVTGADEFNLPSSYTNPGPGTYPTHNKNWISNKNDLTPHKKDNDVKINT